MFKPLLVLVLLIVFFPGAAVATTYKVSGDKAGDVLSYTMKEGETLYDIARKADIGIVALLAANPEIDPADPEAGTAMKLPASHVLPDIPRKGIVINLAELRLFYFPDPNTVMTFPLSIGKDGWQTPTGSTKVLRKRKNPVWTPPPSLLAENPKLPRFMPAGPDNPLGAFALDLGWEGYLIHGTNQPLSIGKRVSHGCMRMYPEDIAALFAAVKVGAPVTVIDTPFKLGWQGDTLFLQVTPTQQQADEIAQDYEATPVVIPGIEDAIRRVAGKDATLDWNAIHAIIARHDGLLVAIAERGGGGTAQR